MWPVCVLVCVSTGDVYALQELSGCASAFRESDSRGRLPLHAAAVQTQPDILHVVLQGEGRPFTIYVAGECVSPTLTLCLCGSDDVHRPEPGGADRGWGHISDSGSRGRPGGQCQDSAAARSITAQHQQQERVSSADR